MVKRLWLVGGVAVAAGAIVVLAFMRPTSSGSGITLVRHESGSFQFLAPAHWQVHDATAAFSGGFVQAVVGTVPVPLGCRLAVVHVDINCYHQERLRPGDISIVLGGGAFRGHDSFEQMRAMAVQMVIGGRLVYRVDHEVTPDSYYDADRSATWYFERDVRAAPDNFFTADAQVRGPSADRLWLQVEALVASLELADE